MWSFGQIPNMTYQLLCISSSRIKYFVTNVQIITTGLYIIISTISLCKWRLLSTWNERFRGYHDQIVRKRNDWLCRLRFRTLVDEVLEIRSKLQHIPDDKGDWYSYIIFTVFLYIYEIRQIRLTIKHNYCKLLIYWQSCLILLRGSFLPIFKKRKNI